MEGSAKDVLVTVAGMREGRAARVHRAHESKQLVQSGQCWACRAYMMHAGDGAGRASGSWRLPDCPRQKSNDRTEQASAQKPGNPWTLEEKLGRGKHVWMGC